MKRMVYSSTNRFSTIYDPSQKLQDIEDVLGIKLKAGIYDLEMFEEDWNAFYQNPHKFVNSAVVDKILQWYNEIYPGKDTSIDQTLI